MPIYIKGVRLDGNNISGISCSHFYSNGHGATTIINGRIAGNAGKEWFKGNGEVNFINCTINGHNIAGSYTAKNINEKIKTDYKQQGDDSKVANLHNLSTNGFNLPSCDSSNDIYTSGSKDQRVKEIKGAINVATNGSGDIISKGDIISQNIMTNGSGDIKATGNVLAYNITSNGSGDISARSIKALNVQVNGSGDISVDDNIIAKNLQVNGSGSIFSERIEITNGEINTKGSSKVDITNLKVEGSSISNFSCIKSETAEIINSTVKLIGTFETSQGIEFNSCDFDIAAQDNNISIIGEGSIYSDGDINVIM